jgi:hypothetical protein
MTHIQHNAIVGMWIDFEEAQEIAVELFGDQATALAPAVRQLDALLPDRSRRR